MRFQKLKVLNNYMHFTFFIGDVKLTPEHTSVVVQWPDSTTEELELNWTTRNFTTTDHNGVYNTGLQDIPFLKLFYCGYPFKVWLHELPYQNKIKFRI